jgi:translation initiation factor 1
MGGMSRLFAGTPFDKPPTCPTCGQPEPACRCLKIPSKRRLSDSSKKRLDSGLVLSHENAAPPADQIARIRTEKRKGNRQLTVITGLEHVGNDLPALCTELKQTLGVGGSVQGRTIELQGDVAERAGQILEVDKGYKVRLA